MKRTRMFETFDFSVLNDPSFKEDSVREEIIAPILKKLGYAPTGPNRVIRSKTLQHPFVMIGSRQHPVNIVPDYTLVVDDVPLLALDAKAPSERIVKSHHVEQAYSYAIHPDVRVRQYALCNGREFAVYTIESPEPLLLIPIDQVDTKWDAVVEALGPKFLQKPELRGFFPDYGMTMRRLGVNPMALHLFTSHYLQDLVRVSDTLYTGSATTMVGSVECLTSFDFSKEILEDLLARLPANVSQAIRSGLGQQPFRMELGGKVVLTCSGGLGEETEGLHETFIPVVVSAIERAEYDPSITLTPRESPGTGSI